MRSVRRDQPRREREEEHYAEGVEEHDIDASEFPLSSSTGSSSSSSSMETGSRWGNTEHLTEHLNGLFPGLEFPQELAKRLLTHASHPAAIDGHNGGFGFIGRRVLESYLSLFLTSCSSLHPSHDFELITSRTLNTYILGEHVGSAWGIGRNLRWTPTVKADRWKNAPASGEEKGRLVRDVGLYKIQGDAVASIMGGVFHQFGGSTAHRLFHTRILPSLLLPGQPIGLLDTFHREAKEICERMGGSEGSLAAPSEKQRVHA